MIILIGSQKGGCGKSTLAINIAAALAKMDKDVIIVDADVQGTSSRWASDRNENLPKVHCVQKYENIKSTLLDLNQRYKFVIVDVAGKDSKELRTAMLVANILLVPFRASQMDLDTMIHLSDLIDTAKGLNESLISLAVINMASTNHLVAEVKEAQAYLQDFPIVKLLNSIIYERKIDRDVVPIGAGVIDIDHTKAKDEIEKLLEEILNHGN